MKLAVFLDFDGTLVDLAVRPDLVVVPKRLSRTLENLSGRLDGALAIITGRPMDAVDAFLAPALFSTAAAHGTERRGADGNFVKPAASVIASAQRIAERLNALVSREPRLVLEQKAGAVALHYRQAPELEHLCRIAMQQAVEGEEGFAVVDGKMVVEARPAGVDKGAAIEWFMNNAPFTERLPVFIGDDRTDEDGFAAVTRMGGVAIKVGDGATAASHRLKNPAAVLRLIRELADCEGPAERLAELLTEEPSK